jgi:transposase-like protein
VISRLTAEWKDEYTRWQKRDLSARHYVYAWADGVYLQARMEEHSDRMLVLLGATPEGKKELIGFQVGVRESAQSWRELLVDLKSRGLNIAPEVAVGDGALGFWKAIEEIFPGTRHQRCWLHKIVNVLDKVPLSVQVRHHAYLLFMPHTLANSVDVRRYGIDAKLFAWPDRHHSRLPAEAG